MVAYVVAFLSAATWSFEPLESGEKSSDGWHA
jgi:hypothetical protein